MGAVFQATLLVRDYDSALAFYVDKLGFELVQDTPLGDGERWVVVRPGQAGCALVLAKARGEKELERVGQQTAGRVSFFLSSDDIEKDYARLTSLGVVFSQPPIQYDYGTVAIFKDLYGTQWDLIQRAH